MTSERRRRGPWTELAVKVVVEDFERVPRHAPRSRPPLNPSLGQDAALCGVRHGNPVGIKERAIGARGRDVPHARFHSSSGHSCTVPRAGPGPVRGCDRGSPPRWTSSAVTLRLVPPGAQGRRNANRAGSPMSNVDAAKPRCVVASSGARGGEQAGSCPVKRQGRLTFRRRRQLRDPDGEVLGDKAIVQGRRSFVPASARRMRYSSSRPGNRRARSRARGGSLHPCMRR